MSVCVLYKLNVNYTHYSKFQTSSLVEYDCNLRLEDINMPKFNNLVFVLLILILLSCVRWSMLNGFNTHLQKK